MNLSFCSFASGSSGNCYLVKSRESAILIDAGISTKKIHAALEETEHSVLKFQAFSSHMSTAIM